MLKACQALIRLGHPYDEVINKEASKEEEEEKEVEEEEENRKINQERRV